MTSGTTPGKPCAGKMIQHKLVTTEHAVVDIPGALFRVLVSPFLMDVSIGEQVC